MSTIHDEEALGKAIQQDTDTIEIEGDLANKVIRIKSTGKVSWVIAVGAIGLAAAALLSAPATGGTTVLASLPALTPAVGVLGAAAAASAVLIAVGGGGVEVLNKLREYDLEQLSDTLIVLRRAVSPEKAAANAEGTEEYTPSGEMRSLSEINRY